MHVSDGILAAPVWAAGFAGAAAVAYATARKLDIEEIPKISVITAVFFVAGFIHLPLGPTSVHLILNGLVGVVLGRRAFIAVLLAVVLQALLFGHGGMTVIGVNAVMLGGGALCAYGVWQLRRYFSFTNREIVFGALAGGAGPMTSGVVLAFALVTSGDAFMLSAGAVLIAHVFIMVVEAAVVGACAGFLIRVKPAVLAGYTPASTLSHKHPVEGAS